MPVAPRRLIQRKAAPQPPATVAPLKLVASVQVMNFAPGVYTVDIAPQPVLIGQEGLAVPCVRLDRLSRGGTAPATAFVSALSDNEFIVPGGPSAFVRVAGADTVPVLMTVYRLDNTPSPEIRVRLFGQEAAMPPPHAVQANEMGEATVQARLLVHIEGVGDRFVKMGEWAGERGSGRAIEGFSLHVATPLTAADVEFQAALGLEWDTPWFQPDEFCGSRGMALPLIGVRVRTRGEAASHTVCRAWASFVGHGERGPFVQGALCACDGAPIEALRIEFGPPDAAPKASTGRRRGLLDRR